MKALSPVQSLAFLITVGLAIGGWCYGLHWKRVASGDLFSSDEKLMIRLQDQIDTLSEENAALHKRLGDSGEEVKTEPTDTGALLEPSPVMPSRSQKIETH